ncbi:MAG TPA: hypothetical protein DG761_10075 [Gammaproteobacteria bacterium]|nr:hypothetical protein [Acidiferrobacteraceae bacterium]MDP6398811.1 hypothetical protein [Arenicellales bacterium]MDP6551201.1 hypothetical protein [Arenicellales bacterium]MDP6919001.1 hypothetical protein [Arenicellales bacterium]HCX88360.1 hypothetical protein [Gammaproteobacteria bacterium]
MSGKLIALTLAYAFSIFVLLLLLIRSRLSMAVRLSVVLAGAVFYLLHYFSLSSLQGWPSSTRLPEAFTLHAWQFQEPNPAQDQSGYIHLWVQAEEWDVPRAYALPYSSVLHDRLETAQARRNAGFLQQGRADGSGTIRFSDSPRRLPTKKETPASLTKD